MTATATGFIVCPTCDGYPDGGPHQADCDACAGRGVVCAWCAGSLAGDATIGDLGRCSGCGSTAAHRTTWPTLAAWTAAYDPATWEGLARRSGEQSARFLADLGECRVQLASVKVECARQRDKVAAAEHETRQACDRARVKIAEMDREVADLRRQLRLASERILAMRAERAA